jgi:hypothetical protein
MKKGLFFLAVLLFVIKANAQNVGIGTTLPLLKLHIKGGLLLDSTNGTTPVSGAGTRLMWIPAKAAFRAGAVSGTQWDDANIGLNSIALGISTKASGDYSTAMGNVTTASGNNSIAMGITTIAQGIYSTAMGSNTTASSEASTAMGQNTVASGINSTAMGKNTIASNEASTAMGAFTQANGLNSTAMGAFTIASNDASTAMGQSTIASGGGSTAMGQNTTASAATSTAMGFFTKAQGLYSTAMGGNTIASNDASTAMGEATTASGINSTAMGQNTMASALNSTAMGQNTIAAGNYSTAMGFYTTAQGYYSTSLGYQTTASAEGSTSMGNGTKSKSYGGLVIGHFNDSTNAANPTAINALNRIFQIGNGTSDVARSNAITVLQNGKVGIGTTTPYTLLHMVRNGNAGATYNAASEMIVENNSNAYIEFSTPAANETGIISSNPTIGLRSAILFTAANGLQLRTGGNVNRLQIDNGGYAAVNRTPNPGTNTGALQVQSIGTSDDILGIYNASGTNRWTYYTSADNLFMYNNGTLRGTWSAVNGVYTNSSDRRLKKDIAELPVGALAKINSLKAYSFRYLDNASTDPVTIGFMAQEVQPLFPEAVTEITNKDGSSSLGLKYQYFGVYAIKAIQEQQQIIDKQQLQIDNLEKMVQELSLKIK